jgi:hypothetical protein
MFANSGFEFITHIPDTINGGDKFVLRLAITPANRKIWFERVYQKYPLLRIGWQVNKPYMIASRDSYGVISVRFQSYNDIITFFIKDL